METITPAVPTTNRRAEFAAYAATLVLTLAATFVVLRLWRADLAVPFHYSQDSFAILTWTKTMVDNGWWLTNKYLGAPTQFEMHDYPTNCNLHFVVLKCLSVFTSNPALLVNLYFILSFPLVALAALTALRSLDVSRGVAVVGSILYAFLPYHFWRGEPHLFLASYYMIPLVCMVIGWIARGEPFLVVRHKDTGRLRLELKSVRAVCSVLICVAVGCDFPYYPMFAGFLLIIAGIYTFARSSSACTVLQTAVLAGVTAVSFLGNMSPSFLYWWENGPNLSRQHVAKRPWTDGESLSLTVTQLLLPAEKHPIPLFSRLRDNFYGSTRLTSEADAMALGAIGSLGFLFLIGCLICCHRSGSERGQLYHLFGVLTACSILLCTAGGFGTAFNLIGFGILRCYNRMSIFIGFLAFAALFTGIDVFYRRYSQRRHGFLLAGVALAALLGVGLADQTGHNYIHPYAVVKEEYRSDANFVARLEQSVPENTMVFQLPYVGFLSYANASHQMLPYSHFRGYLHSQRLRWSFGAMHGRFGDNLQAQLASLPIEGCVRELAFLGFGGIFVDRFGYVDAGKELETKLRTLLGSEPIVSRNGRLSFFAMAGFNQRLRQGYSEDEWQKQHDHVYYTPQAQWGTGFYAEETAGSDRGRWCTKKGTLVILNPSDRSMCISLRFIAKTCLPGAAKLSIKSSLFSEHLTVDVSGSAFAKTALVPPGRHVIQFHCTASPFVHPSRTIVFGVYNFQLEQIDPPQDKVRLARH